MVQAEELTRDTGRLFDVVGWYHSHPNITVFPSQVDINTQLSMQMIGSDFIGLIFSAFIGSTTVSGASAIGKTELIAFQSYDDYADGQKKARTLRLKIFESDNLLGEMGISSLPQHDFYSNICLSKKLIKKTMHNQLL